MVSAAYAVEAIVLRAAEALDAEADSVVDGLPDPDLADRAALEAAEAKVVVDQTALATTGGSPTSAAPRRPSASAMLDRHWRKRLRHPVHLQPAAAQGRRRSATGP